MTDVTQYDSPLPPAKAEIPADLLPHRLSVVVPLYNEEDNVDPLLARIHEALDGCIGLGVQLLVKPLLD